MKRAKSGSGFRTRFWGPLILAHFPQAPKRSHFRARIWEAGDRHDLHSGARLWNRKSGGARIKNQCQMQSDN